MFEAKQLRRVSPPPPLAPSHLSYILQVSLFGTETVYFMLSSVLFFFFFEISLTQCWFDFY